MKAKRKPNKIMVKSPEGYHWMSKQGRFYLMPHEGKFVKDLTLIGDERYSVVKFKKKFTNNLTNRNECRKFVKQKH